MDRGLGFTFDGSYVVGGSDEGKPISMTLVRLCHILLRVQSIGLSSFSSGEIGECEHRRLR